MTQYIEETVQETASNPSQNSDIELCINCTTNDKDPIKNTITTLGGEVIDSFTTPTTNGLVVTVPERSVQTLIDHKNIRTIETNKLSLSTL